jgi:hypothetical protein
MHKIDYNTVLSIFRETVNFKIDQIEEYIATMELLIEKESCGDKYLMKISKMILI